MTRFSWHGYEVEVDKTATSAWYAEAEDWGCACGRCRNFLTLARERRLPGEILEILDRLSVPPARATYVCELYHDKNWKEKGLLYQFSWRIGGAVLAVPPGENGPGWGPLIERPWGGLVLGHGDYPYGAPDFPKPHFDLECQIWLPWVLDEPVAGAAE